MIFICTYTHAYTHTYTSTPYEWRQEQEPSQPHPVGILKRQCTKCAVAVCCSVLQGVAVCCSVLQTQCNIALPNFLCTMTVELTFENNYMLHDTQHMIHRIHRIHMIHI